ncbi:rod shape-determining protein MreC [Raphidiopsis sp. BLCC-F218]
MFTIRRWWEHKTLKLAFLGLILGGAWTLKETNGELLMELYQSLISPLTTLQSSNPTENRIRDAKVMELETRIVELKTQNQRLQKLLGYVEKGGASNRPVVARVVGRSGDNWWQQVTVNRGSKAGIKAGFVVKAEGGLVGLVQTVTPHTSRVLLISDVTSQVGVTISRSAAKGIMRGDYSGEGVLEFYEKVPNIKIGDLVSTSTYSRKFPPGEPVGKIKSLDLKKLPAPLAKVELFPPIRYLDWVTIYPHVPEKL